LIASSDKSIPVANLEVVYNIFCKLRKIIINIVVGIVNNSQELFKHLWVTRRVIHKRQYPQLLLLDKKWPSFFLSRKNVNLSLKKEV